MIAVTFVSRGCSGDVDPTTLKIATVNYQVRVVTQFLKETDKLKWTVLDSRAEVLGLYTPNNVKLEKSLIALWGILLECDVHKAAVVVVKAHSTPQTLFAPVNSVIEAKSPSAE